MLKKIFKMVIMLLIFLGLVLGIFITVKNMMPETKKKNSFNNKIFDMIQVQEAEITKCFTYGRSLNVEGSITNISKDNLESVKLVTTDGEEILDYNSLDYEFKDDKLYFYSKDMNENIILDDLDINTKQFVLIRLTLNNSIDPKFYSLKNVGKFDNIEYYGVTKDGKNKKANIKFENVIRKSKEYSFLTIEMLESTLPEDVYDIVIDAARGGTDVGVTSGNISEAQVTLEYAKLIQAKLEDKGYKVKLTRDDENSSSYTATNMYSENGRITTACKSKAKLMISLHLNKGVDSLKGFEIYAPGNINYRFPKELALDLNESTNLKISNNISFREADGVYVKNYNKRMIKETADSAAKKGYEPYPITENTPFIYTIREVGGIATGAYVDGRNTYYDKNKFYDTNQGIECYQLELGYIKNDLDTILKDKDVITSTIADSIVNNY